MSNLQFFTAVSIVGLGGILVALVASWLRIGWALLLLAVWSCTFHAVLLLPWADSAVFAEADPTHGNRDFFFLVCFWLVMFTVLIGLIIFTERWAVSDEADVSSPGGQSPVRTVAYQNYQNGAAVGAL